MRALRLTVLVSAALLYGTAGADTLVMRTGAQVETRGPWKVKGNLIVFTGADGKLASMRAADVDLDKSASATAKASAQPARQAPAAKPAKPVVLRLTDNDVGHAEAAEKPAEKAGEPAPEPAPAAGTALVVQGWDQHPGENGDGILITGSLMNPTKNTAIEITVDIGLYGTDGKLIQITRASLGSETLPPGGKTTFRCAFPGVIMMSAAKFDVRSKPLVNVQQLPAESPPPPGATP